MSFLNWFAKFKIDNLNLIHTSCFNQLFDFDKDSLKALLKKNSLQTQKLVKEINCIFKTANHLHSIDFIQKFDLKNKK